MKPLTRERITLAIQRIADNQAPRRIPADPSDVDLVLSDCLALLDRAEAAEQASAAGILICESLAAEVSALRAALEGVGIEVQALTRREAGWCIGQCGLGPHDVDCAAARDALASTADTAASHDAALVRKERGMVACLQNALFQLERWVGERVINAGLLDKPKQVRFANKVLADGEKMAAEHTAAIRAAALEECARMLEDESWDLEREVPELVRRLAAEKKPEGTR